MEGTINYLPSDIRARGGLRGELSFRNAALKEELLAAPQTHSYQQAKLSREAYERYREEPWPIRRAKVLAHLLEHMTIYIRDGELIVGNRSEALGAMPRIPPGLHPVSAAFCEQAPFPAGEGEERWENRFLFQRYHELLSPETRELEEELVCGLAPGSHEGFGHILADYELVIRRGISGILEEIEAIRAVTPAADSRKIQFLTASAIAWKGVAVWAERYAILARQLAEETAEPGRKAELLRIADVCGRVPYHPAGSFAEALQSFWFAHQALHIEQKAGSISVSGLDQYLNEYLLQDIRTRVLTWEQADVLVESFMLKFMENAIWPVKVQQFAHLSLGGCDAAGNDAANELSFLLLNGQIKLGGNAPLISVRWHKNINPEFWRLAHRCIRKGSGLPALFSDDAMIPSLLSWGVPRGQAVQYGVVGCVEPSVRGEVHGTTLGGHLNLAKCLELALNNGRSLQTGKRLGPDTGCLADFASLDQVLAAYAKQVEHAMEHNAKTVYAAAVSQKERFSYPLMSALMHDSLRLGRDITEGVNVSMPTVCILGITNVVDSLLVLERQVFGGTCPATELLAALQNNFEGAEPLRRRLLNDPRRFGNGFPGTAALYNRVCAIHKPIVEGHRGPRGGHFSCGVWPVQLHVRFGKRTGALPCGRRAGEPLVDGVGPCQGAEQNGPTAVARDMAAVDAPAYWPGGYTFNMMFSRTALQGEENLQSFASFTDTFFRLGGMQLQINTESADTMRAAQLDPQSHGNLVVRVAGFSTYFIGLDQATQDEIISRTAHVL